MRRSNTARIALALTIVAIGGADVFAHRRDELLQAARIAVAANRVELELSLTPGTALADDVIGEIDRDRDGMLSPQEQRRFAAQVFAATELRIDGSILTMDLGTGTFPAAGDLRGGDRSIELRSGVTLPSLASGRHEIAFTNNYRGDISVYLANALKPDSPRIVIASQKRDETQHALAIDFTVEGEGFATLPMWGFGAGAVAWLVTRRRFLQPASKARAATGVAIGQSAT